MLVFFMLGVACCDWRDELSFVKKIPSWCVIGCFAVAEGMKIMDIRGGQIAELLPYLGIAAVMVLSFLLERWNGKGNGWLLVVSASSYIIYLFHTTFEGFAKAVIHKMPFFVDGNNEVLFCINVTMVVVCGVLCPIILHRYVLNKTYITKLLFGLK